ncbi:MAG: branched-chain amino acid ABC transporter permease [Actinomycetota bacterium]|nr:branched-chain amino acid ABC transporter permease [Actinomycetota bacterium]
MPNVAAGASGQRATSAQIWRRRAIDLASVLVPTVLFALARTVDSNLLLLVSIMVYVVLAQGVNVIYGFTGYLPFGYVGFFGAGAYGAYVAVAHLGANAVEATALGGVAAVLVGVVLIPLLRLRGAYFAIASLAAALALSSIVSNPAVTSVTNGPYGADLTRVFSSGGSYWTAVVIVALAMVSVVALRRSRLGLLLRAVRADQVSASCAGVNVVAARTGAWLLSALLAGLAGAVYAWSISVFYPTAVFDTTISLFAIVFALFGGVGTVLGPVVGAVVLYYVYNAIGVNDPQYFQLIFGVVIVIIALFLPGGLAALALGARRRLGARRGLGGAQPVGGSDVR